MQCIILALGKRTFIKPINLKFKGVDKTTDVLTFVSSFKYICLDKTKYCDIFFSSETIYLDSKKNKINFYEHFTHLLVHSFLHINGFVHKKINGFVQMKKEEIKVLKKLSIANPYLL